MRNQLFHVFRNTPFGRETLMQSIYFCKMTKTSLKVYIPKHPQFLMYFENEIVTVDLDRSFLKCPKTAREHAESIIKAGGLEPSFLTPKRFTASTLPDIPVNFKYMCCPRSISDLSTKISLGFIGPRVRVIIKNATFPVLIPTPVYKEWRSIMVFFGGSANAINAFRLGKQISELSGFPLMLFTQKERPYSKLDYEKILKENMLFDDIEKGKVEWLFFEKGKFEENLYDVPHDALVVVGAYGHGLIKELFFGSKMEEIQTVFPNNMLIVGPHYVEY